MDVSASAALPPLLSPVSFYGLQSRKRSLNIKRSLENCSKRLKDEKIPQVYNSRILGPSVRWKIFYRQREALDFVKSKTEDLHVFAFESCQLDKQSGQRQFLAATYPVFWHYYMQLDESQRHHYEVIPEGHPCKLYFDLEFQKPVNPEANGLTMVNTLIKYVCLWLKMLYGTQCDRDNVLELSASTEIKFSRHLIFQHEGSIFKDNIMAGRFVRAIFALLEDHLHEDMDNQKDNSDNTAQPSRTEEENQTNSSNDMNCTGLSVSLPEADGGEADHALKENEHPSISRDSTESDSPTHDDREQSRLTPLILDEDCGDDRESNTRTLPQTSTYYCKPSEDVTDERSVYHRHCGERESSKAKTVKAKEGLTMIRQWNKRCSTRCWSETASDDHTKYFVYPDNEDGDNTKCPAERDGKIVTLSSKGNAAFQGSHDPTAVEESTSDKVQRVEVSDSIGEMIYEMNKFCCRVFQEFDQEELRSLFVKDKDGRDTCFADLGVYTKNRNFRLYKSCKLGKSTAFTVAEHNTYTATDSSDDTVKETEIFLASLITNIRDNGRHLTFGEGMNVDQPSHKYRPYSSAPHSSTNGEHIDGCGKSPYPEVDNFISGLVSGHGGAIRRWTYFPTAEILSCDIVGYRFCYNVQRQHRSNNIKLVADLQRGVWYQKCYDPDCQAVNFKSQEFQLPKEILPAYYFADDFEDVADDNFDEDDEACVLALENVEMAQLSTDANI